MFYFSNVRFPNLKNFEIIINIGLIFSEKRLSPLPSKIMYLHPHFLPQSLMMNTSGFVLRANVQHNSLFGLLLRKGNEFMDIVFTAKISLLGIVIFMSEGVRNMTREGREVIVKKS